MKNSSAVRENSLEFLKPHPELFPVAPFLFKYVPENAHYFLISIAHHLDMPLVPLYSLTLNHYLHLQLSAQVISPEIELFMLHAGFTALFHNKVCKPVHVPHLINRDGFCHPAGVALRHDESVAYIYQRGFDLMDEILVQYLDNFIGIQNNS